MNRKSLLSLYNSFLCPYITYAIHVWGGTYRSYLEPLFLLQKKAVRCILFLRKYDRVSYNFSNLSIMFIENVYKYELILFMYRFYKGTLPNSFQNYFTKNNQVHNYNTRFACNIRIPLYRSVLGHTSFHYNAAKSWNEIGSDLYIKTINLSCSCFKRNLKSHLLDKQ